MTSFSDLSIMQQFSGVFVFFLVFIVVYAFLQFTKLFNKTEGAKGIYAVIAIVVAFIVSLSKGAFTAITNMTPWFATLIVFLFLVMFVLKIFTGPDDELFPKLIKDKPAVYWTLIGIFIIILISSFTPAIQYEHTGNQIEKEQFEQKHLSSSTSSDNETITTGVQRSQVYATNTNQDTRPPQTIGDQVLQTILHPQMLGVLLLFFIAGFAVLLLTRSNSS